VTLYYLDSSVWVKRYLIEAGSHWIQNLFDHHEACACCSLGYVEVSAAIARQQGVRQISPDRQRILRRDLLVDWNEMLQVSLDPGVIQLAADLAWEHKLRGADAIHLAAASQLRDQAARRSLDLVLVTADAELIRAANEFKLVVTNPAELT
jgi:uncharacterized protein